MKIIEFGVVFRGIFVWGVNLVIIGVAVSWGDRDVYFIILILENIEGMLYKIILSGFIVINGIFFMFRRSVYI